MSSKHFPILYGPQLQAGNMSSVQYSQWHYSCLYTGGVECPSYWWCWSFSLSSPSLSLYSLKINTDCNEVISQVSIPVAFNHQTFLPSIKHSNHWTIAFFSIKWLYIKRGERYSVKYMKLLLNIPILNMLCTFKTFLLNFTKSTTNERHKKNQYFGHCPKGTSSPPPPSFWKSVR